jgi:hypothetical protein
MALPLLQRQFDDLVMDIRRDPVTRPYGSVQTLPAPPAAPK